MVRASGTVSLRDTWFGARLPEDAVDQARAPRPARHL